MRGGEWSPIPSRRGAVAGLAVWAVVVVAGIVWTILDPLPEEAGVHAGPFYGRWELHDLLALLPAVAVAASAVWAWPLVVDRLRPVAASLAAGAVGVGWSLVLAASGGLDRIWSPLASRYGYLGVGLGEDPSTFLHHYVDRLSSYPVHVKGHPPGMPLALMAIDALGLSGARGAAVLVLGTWGLGIAAVVATTIELGGVAAGRRVACLLPFLPAAVFAGTTFDAFFAGAMAITIAALVFAARRTGWRSDVAAVAGGAAGAACLHLSYGLAPLVLVPLAVLWRERRVRPTTLAALGAAAGVGSFVAAGFWWLDGLDATRGFYEEGLASVRPYAYFVFAGNPAAFALALGPAVAAGVGALAGRHPLRRGREVLAAGWPVVALAAIVAVTAADVSGLSKAEVERIWLPFALWVAVATAAVGSTATRRWWLGASLALGIVLQAGLVTPW